MFCSSDLTQREEVEVWPWIAATNNCVLKGAISNEGNSEFELLFYAPTTQALLCLIVL